MQPGWRKAHAVILVRFSARMAPTKLSHFDGTSMLRIGVHPILHRADCVPWRRLGEGVVPQGAYLGTPAAITGTFGTLGTRDAAGIVGIAAERPSVGDQGSQIVVAPVAARVTEMRRADRAISGLDAEMRIGRGCRHGQSCGWEPPRRVSGRACERACQTPAAGFVVARSRGVLLPGRGNIAERRASRRPASWPRCHSSQGPTAAPY